MVSTGPPVSTRQNNAAGLIDDCKLPISVNVSGDGCLFLSVVLQKVSNLSMLYPSFCSMTAGINSAVELAG